MASSKGSTVNLLALTDCLYFTNGSCAFSKKCHYRHCQAALKQLVKCPNWPESCRDVTCPYRHTAMVAKKIPEIFPQAKGLVVFFWNIENVPVPKTQRAIDIVQRIRQKFVTERGLQEIEFSCYCNSNILSEEQQKNLHHATVRMIHVPDRKPGAIDRQIILELDRVERAYRPPTTIVLISRDIDFLGKLSDLRHGAGFQVIVIHNKPAEEEWQATVNEQHSWQSFIESSQAVISDDSQMLVNPSATSRPVLRARQNNDGNTTTPDLEQSKSRSSRRHARSVPRKRRPSNHSRPPTLHVQKDASSSDLPPTVVPKHQAPSMNSYKQLIQRCIQKSVSHEDLPSVVSDHSRKNQPISFSCPHCMNEFSTITALHQHQNDKKHLFDCPICNDGFPTETGLRQHQNAKKHLLSNEITTHE